MTYRARLTVLLAVLAAVGVFVWWTSRALPPVVASHFALSGKADGFSPRGDYVAWMIVLVALVPLLPALLPGALARNGEGVNIPHREYWLSPGRRSDTLAFVRGHGLWLAGALALFLGYCHWLTVEAHTKEPPALSTGGFLAGLSIFLVGLAVWLWILFARFRTPQ